MPNDDTSMNKDNLIEDWDRFLKQTAPTLDKFEKASILNRLRDTVAKAEAIGREENIRMAIPSDFIKKAHETYKKEGRAEFAKAILDKIPEVKGNIGGRGKAINEIRSLINSELKDI